MATLRIRIPDAQPIEIPDNDQSVDEIRRGLIAAGYTQLETATGRREDDTVVFERPTGGDKGAF